MRLRLIQWSCATAKELPNKTNNTATNRNIWPSGFEGATMR
jgi:hypothetical protein